MQQRINPRMVIGHGPTSLTHASGRLDLERPRVMGIVNVTPDSFSDGGRFLDVDAAIDHGMRLIDEGADLLDIGGESTRPGAQPVDARDERARVIPVIEALAKRTTTPISIDTSKSDVARHAMAAGASIINDVTGLHGDPDMASVAARTGAGLVLMHMLGEPRTMQIDPTYHDLLASVTEYWQVGIARAREAGVDDASICLDPGIGFGKTLHHNLELLRRLPELGSLGFPLLVGPSRKSFIRMALADTIHAEAQEDPAGRIWGTAASVACAVSNGASIIRVHDVREMRQVVDLAGQLIPEGVRT